MTVNQALNHLCRLDIVREMTGQKRNARMERIKFYPVAA